MNAKIMSCTGSWQVGMTDNHKNTHTCEEKLLVNVTTKVQGTQLAWPEPQKILAATAISCVNVTLHIHAWKNACKSHSLSIMLNIPDPFGCDKVKKKHWLQPHSRVGMTYDPKTTPIKSKCIEVILQRGRTHFLAWVIKNKKKIIVILKWVWLTAVCTVKQKYRTKFALYICTLAVKRECFIHSIAFTV